MSKLSAGPIHELSLPDLRSGVWIVLIDADKIPPHLMLIEQGVCHSLEYDGYKTYTPSALFKIFTTKKKAVLAAKVQYDSLNAASFFSSYENTSGFTCLYPIKDCIQSKGLDVSGVNFIFELLPQLDKKNGITLYKGLNLVLENERFTYQTYTREEIDRRIENLKKQDA